MNLIAYLPDVLFLLVAVTVGWFVGSQKLVESIAYLFAFLLAGLAAIAWHGPLGWWSQPTWMDYRDIFAERYIWFLCFLLVYWTVFVFLIALFFKALAERAVFSDKLEKIGRYTFGLLTGYLVASTLLVAVHTFPGGRDFDGAFPPEPWLRAGPIMRIAPDYQLLTVADHVCNPSDPITGAPWKLRGPFLSNEIENGDYGSFPLRYCIWRETMLYR